LLFLKQSLDNVIELVKCSMNKFKDNSYRKLGILFQKHSNGFHNRKETNDYIKCRIDNCNENLKKNNLIYNIKLLFEIISRKRN